MYPLVLPGAAIELAFDPVLRIGDWSVRWETVAIAAVVLLALVLGAVAGRTTPIDPDRPPDAPGPDPGTLNRLRADDLLYIVVAALPGAVVGGRLGYALVHLDFYTADPGLLIDAGHGGLQLSLAVVGAIVTASAVARLLGAPVGRWMHALAIPVLLALAGGKAAMALGGTGQGAPTALSWATAYVGPGPWGSLAPQVPAHPAQLYEAAATLGVVLVVMWVLAFGAFPGRNGGALLFGVGAWAAARSAVATTWRDPAVLGDLRVDQLISISIAIGCLVLMALVGGMSAVRGRRRRSSAVGAADAGGADAAAREADRRDGTATGDAEWPDPADRPRI